MRILLTDAPLNEAWQPLGAYMVDKNIDPTILAVAQTLLAFVANRGPTRPVNILTARMFLL
ncbi:MAG: hypothetical protein P8J68_07135 [Arenicellaceae bacterium]|nr:hypothetical protein [Arenicellaceae bacterium]